MQIEAALVKERGVTFVVTPVKRDFLSSNTRRDELTAVVSAYFDGVPAILMAQDSRGTATYYGRKDIVRYLSHVSPHRLPWKKYSIN